jgi:hypothetical protein
MPRWLLTTLAGISAAACAAHPGTPPARTPAPAKTVGVAPVVAAPSPSEPPPRTPRPNRCLPDGPPKARAAPRIYEPSTCVDHRRAETILARKIVKDYERTVTGSIVDVSFGCDPLTQDLQEVVIELGFGHGGSLEIWRIRRDESGSDFSVLGIGNRGYYAPSTSGAPVRIGRGHIPAGVLEKALARARPALTVMVREIEPPPPPNGALGRSFSSSSGDFHHYFRLTDGMHELVRHYTGYPSSSDQPRYVGVTAAMEALRPLLESVPLDGSDPNAEERELFVRSFLAAAPRFDEPFAGWVRDRYLMLAEHLGTPELVPALVRELERGLSEGEGQPDDGHEKITFERRLEYSLAALARITGWDPRKDEVGAARAPSSAAREMVEECKRALQSRDAP